jgi:glycine hydroxymethyltransferase
VKDGMIRDLSGSNRAAAAAALLRAQHKKSVTAVNLVPSENRLSPNAQLPLQLDFYNRYFFNEELDDNGWEFRGGEHVAALETVDGCAALRRLSQCKFVNLRPISGLSAMLIAIAAQAGTPDSAVVSISPASGGHYATGAVIERLGYRPIQVRCAGGQVDLAQLRQALAGGDVSLVYLDLQNSLHILDVYSVASLLTEWPDTHLHVDCSHTMGLVFGGAHPNPIVSGAGSFGGSTHKTFPGPHKGVLMTPSEETSKRFKEAQFHLVSSHHFAETLSAAMTALEFETYGKHYARVVIDNARALGAALADHGFDVVRASDGITDTHQVWVRLDNAMELSNELAHLTIRVNVQSELPGCPGLAWRLGTSELSVLGAGVDDMSTVADIIALARDGKIDKAAATSAELRRYAFTSPYWSRSGFPDEPVP